MAPGGVSGGGLGGTLAGGFDGLSLGSFAGGFDGLSLGSFAGGFDGLSFAGGLSGFDGLPLGSLSGWVLDLVALVPWAFVSFLAVCFQFLPISETNKVV